LIIFGFGSSTRRGIIIHTQVGLDLLLVDRRRITLFTAPDSRLRRRNGGSYM
jgi:hypothetical protein